MRIFDMKMVRGDTCYIGVKINGLPENQEPENIIFTVRKGLRNREIIIEKDLTDGIEFEEEKYIIGIWPDDTEQLSHGRYVYDLELTTLTGRLTVISGIFDIMPDVTRH